MEQNELYYVIFEGRKDPQIVYGKEEMLAFANTCTQPRIRTFQDEASAVKYYKAFVELIGRSDPIDYSRSTSTNEFKKAKIGESNRGFLEEERKNNIYAETNNVVKSTDNNQNFSTQMVVEEPQKKTYFQSKKDNGIFFGSHGRPTIFSNDINPEIFSHFTEREDDLVDAKLRINQNETYRLHFHGCLKGNPGVSGASYLIYNHQKERVYLNFMNVGKGTNNQAEYIALIYGMTSALNLGIKRLEVYGDSQLVVQQMAGAFQVRDKNMQRLNQEAEKLAGHFEKITYTWVKREENLEAHKLSNMGANLNGF